MFFATRHTSISIGGSNAKAHQVCNRCRDSGLVSVFMGQCRGSRKRGCSSNGCRVVAHVKSVPEPAGSGITPGLLIGLPQPRRSGLGQADTRIAPQLCYTIATRPGPTELIQPSSPFPAPRAATDGTNDKTGHSVPYDVKFPRVLIINGQPRRLPHN